MLVNRDKTCYECGRTVERLAENDINLRPDGNCDECHIRLMEVWELEKRELEKYWRDTRL